MQMSRRTTKWVAAATVVAAVALSTTVLAASNDGPSTVGALAAGPAATSDLDVEQRIVASMQGAQLDVWVGGEPAPGRTTTMFVHRGLRAAELYWTTDGWCLARTFAWRLEHVQSDVAFDVRYTVDGQDTRCLMDDGDTLVVRLFDIGRVDGRRTWAGANSTPATGWTQRTHCTPAWDDPAPCGFPVEAITAAAWP